MSDISLYKLCIEKTAALLKEYYWPVTAYSSYFDVGNPFVTFPSDIVEELIAAVIQLTGNTPLRVQDLYPILTSGRVKHFKLEDVLILIEEFVGILTALSTCGQHLNSLILRQVYCTGLYQTVHDVKKQHLQSSAIECLLALSPNLKIVETDIKFDLKTIQKIQSLQQLELNFVPQNTLYDIIPKIDGTIYIPNDTITHISILETHRNIIPFEEIVFLLKYCRNLICIENSISKPLEYLHGEELYCGTLSKEYKLQKCTLGSMFLNKDQAVASVNAIHIATITCPHTKELSILLNDHQAIAALCDFGHLNWIKIQWDEMTPGDFRLGLQLLLHNIGNQLKNLKILNFTNVDFAAVGILCPNLESLKVEYDTEICSYDPSEVVCFQYLESLHVECIEGLGASSETLMLLLSNCKNVVSLYLENNPLLCDTVIFNLMEKNKLPKMKEATIIDCNLTEESLKCLAKNCSSLEFLCFRSYRIPFEAAVAAVHDVNPFIIMTTGILEMHALM